MDPQAYRFLETRVDLLKHKDHDRTEERRTSSEIFDESTLMVLYKLLSEGIFDTLEFPISTGKEANVFRGTKGDRFVAVKLFRVATSTFRNYSMYIVGDPRFRNTGRDHRSLIYTWARKEFKNLARMAESGIRVPSPIECRSNVLVMEYIGTPGRAAPMLRDVPLGPKALAGVQQTLLDYMDLCYNRAGLVHGDLSEYNVLIRGKSEPVLIDVGQAVMLEHPMAPELFIRDLKNLAAYFKRKGLGFDWMAVHDRITSKKKEQRSRDKDRKEEE